MLNFDGASSNLPTDMLLLSSTDPVTKPKRCDRGLLEVMITYQLKISLQGCIWYTRAGIVFRLSDVEFF